MAPRPRWVLHMQAQVWRVLMSLGMFFHRLASPRPPKHSFSRTIKSTVSVSAGSFQLHFFVPKDYNTRRKLGFQKKYPVVINFHGGGFTLGSFSDDARWIATVIDECQAVVVGVEYRLAPEHPFPTAVEDGVDSVLWVAEHAEELGIDTDKIALSGFSSGANMAFTVPLRLYDYLTGYSRSLSSRDPSQEDLSATTIIESQDGNAASGSSSSTLDGAAARPSFPATGNDSRLNVPINSKKSAVSSVKTTANVSLCAIVPWYPSTDYTRSREQRRSTCTRKDQELPSLFTDLFDESYLHPPGQVPLDSPYLSPGIANSQHLRNALPQEIVMFTCEWDMLLQEGQEFHKRLVSDEVGKHVVYQMIEGVPHGWDKAPNPIKPTPGVKEHYRKACRELRRVFGEPVSAQVLERRRKESVPVVR